MWGEDKNGVPTADSADNNTIMDVIGNKTDTHAGSSLYAQADSTNDHIHSEAKVWPTLADAVTLTATVNDWTDFGTKVEVVAAAAIGSPFDIHFVSIEAISAIGQYEVKLWSGAAGAVEIGHMSFSRTAAHSREGSQPVTTPIQPADTKIMASMASNNANADTVDVKIAYHTY